MIQLSEKEKAEILKKHKAEKKKEENHKAELKKGLQKPQKKA
jgi:hypothetical protein